MSLRQECDSCGERLQLSTQTCHKCGNEVWDYE